MSGISCHMAKTRLCNEYVGRKVSNAPGVNLRQGFSSARSVSNGPIQFENACKVCPLLELFANVR